MIYTDKSLLSDWDSSRTQPGEISNGTRTPRPYVFTEEGLLEAAEEYDNKKHRLYPPPHTIRPILSWFATKYHGYASSQIYTGGLSEAILPNRNLTCEAGSWLDQKYKVVNLPRIERSRATLKIGTRYYDTTIYNASSFAVHSAMIMLIQIRLREVEKLAKKRLDSIAHPYTHDNQVAYIERLKTELRILMSRRTTQAIRTWTNDDELSWSNLGTPST